MVYSKAKAPLSPLPEAPFSSVSCFLLLLSRKIKHVFANILNWKRSCCSHCSAPCFWSRKIYFGDISIWAVINLLCVCTYTYSIIFYQWMYCLVSPILTDLWFFPDYFIDFKLNSPPSRILRNNQFYFPQGWWPLFVLRTLSRCS